jgi:predicted DNA-binding transcriptional regulator AlpA
MADRILNQHEVQRATNMSRTTIWRLEREGEFPRRRQIVGHRIGWLESEVVEWIQGRPLASDQGRAA